MRRILGAFALATVIATGSCESSTSPDPAAGTFDLTGTYTTYTSTYSGQCGGFVYSNYCTKVDSISQAFHGTLTVPGTVAPSAPTIYTGVEITLDGLVYAVSGTFSVDSASGAGGAGAYLGAPGTSSTNAGYVTLSGNAGQPSSGTISVTLGGGSPSTPHRSGNFTATRR